MTDSNELYDIAILGGGPGGMTAGLYAARGEMKALLLDKGALGGAVLLSEKYDNFPGYPGGIGSFELARRIEQHLREFEIEIRTDNVVGLRHYNSSPLFEIEAEDRTYYSKSVVLATGTTPRRLPAKNADKLFGRGVSTCAVCDGAFYKGKPLAVIGGGDAACEEGVYLTRYATKVYIIHRRDELRAKAELANEARENEKVEFIMDSVPEEIIGDVKVEGLKIANVKTGEETVLDVAGVFVYIGSLGNSDFIELPIKRSEHGHVYTDALGETGVPGLYAIGDLRSEPFNQAIIACGQGAQAALMADKYNKTIPAEALEKFAAKV